MNFSRVLDAENFEKTYPSHHSTYVLLFHVLQLSIHSFQKCERRQTTFTCKIFLETQLGNLEQLELELKEAQENMQKIQNELDEKNKILGERELKQRELVIITTEK